MFGIDAIELILLIVLGVLLFGPEKLPEFSRKAARVVVAVRDIANNAQTQLRQELGPEYADLDIKDLNPKAFISKHMSAEVALIEETKRELRGARDTVKEAQASIKDAATLARSETKGIESAVKGKVSTPDVPIELPFDLEAT
ncbi:sec-independent translocase [Tessaracoccus antarcticus]|uniref:Sec-independent protein translocase subunit TatB n=1 Tax=Tessaracoccus antarcticus TaxID=2479848 RepID=A0A3M0G106_9ACTN|nr:sec-independent translocase [Tessaracoccus antarcticus]RMB58435.1 Sec-independent protein translocase subunit TatB [Tessaracoccus antarcticus]